MATFAAAITGYCPRKNLATGFGWKRIYDK